MVDASGIGPLLGKGVKNMLQERFAHADSRIGDRPAVGDLRVSGVDTGKERGDGAADFVVFDAVGINIEKNLPQMQRTSVYPRKSDRIGMGIVGHGDAGFGGPLFDNGQHLHGQTVQIQRFAGQGDLSAFQLAHLQNVVDEGKQMGWPPPASFPGWC